MYVFSRYKNVMSEVYLLNYLILFKLSEWISDIAFTLHKNTVWPYYFYLVDGLK